MSVLLDVRDLVVEHRRSTLLPSPPIRAVDGAELQVAAGERVALVGPSGCGKTSLLRAAIGLYPRARGSVRVLDVDPALKRRPPPRAQMLFQDAGAALHPLLTVRATLAESARVHCPRDFAAVDRALHSFGLDHRADALPSQLSGGEKRRVTLAMLLLADPLLVLADEPTAGLDAARKAEVLDLILARQSAHTGLLLVTHDLVVARHACTRVVVLDAGRVVDQAPTGALHRLTHPVARRLTAAARPLGV